MQDMLQNKTQVETVIIQQHIILSDDDFEIKSKIYSFNLRLVLKHISCILKMSFFGICFLLYFFKLSAGDGFRMGLVKEKVNSAIHRKVIYSNSVNMSSNAHISRI